MTTHTPGPWRVDAILPDANKGHTFEPRVSISAAFGEGRIRLADIPDPLTAEEMANARLIAAAPEMLALIKAYRAATSRTGQVAVLVDKVALDVSDAEADRLLGGL